MLFLLNVIGYVMILGGVVSALRCLREAGSGPAIGRLIFGLMFIALGWWLSSLQGL